MADRTPDDVHDLEGPRPAPEQDVANEGGPTQAGADRSETPNPPGSDA